MICASYSSTVAFFTYNIIYYHDHPLEILENSCFFSSTCAGNLHIDTYDIPDIRFIIQDLINNNWSHFHMEELVRFKRVGYSGNLFYPNGHTLSFGFLLTSSRHSLIFKHKYTINSVSLNLSSVFEYVLDTFDFTPYYKLSCCSE